MKNELNKSNSNLCNIENKYETAQKIIDDIDFDMLNETNKQKFEELKIVFNAIRIKNKYLNKVENNN